MGMYGFAQLLLTSDKTEYSRGLKGFWMGKNLKMSVFGLENEDEGERVRN